MQNFSTHLCAYWRRTSPRTTRISWHLPGFCSNTATLEAIRAQSMPASRRISCGTIGHRNANRKLRQGPPHQTPKVISIIRDEFEKSNYPDSFDDIRRKFPDRIARCEEEITKYIASGMSYIGSRDWARMKTRYFTNTLR